VSLNLVSNAPLRISSQSVIDDEVSRRLLFGYFLDRVKSRDVDRVLTLSPLIATAASLDSLQAGVDSAESNAPPPSCSQLASFLYSLCAGLHSVGPALFDCAGESAVELASALFPHLVFPLAARMKCREDAEAAWRRCRERLNSDAVNELRAEIDANGFNATADDCSAVVVQSNTQR
jgi:hypothetical protein